MAIREIMYRRHPYKISYTIQNPENSQTILVLHGWGSNKEIMMQAFGNLLPTYKHLYIDLPGFGKSSNDIVLTTQEYAEIVKLFLYDLSIEPTIVMGHSFGGKIATLLDPHCLVLLSSSGIQVPKPLSVRLKIALFKIARKAGATALRDLFVSDDAKGMPPHMYETFKNVVNEEFAHHFGNVSGKALLFWGKEDTATPLWTGETIASKIEDATLYPLDGDHYFFLEHAPFIAERIETDGKGVA